MILFAPCSLRFENVAPGAKLTNIAARAVLRDAQASRGLAMKHASQVALDKIEDYLDRLRKLAMKEKQRGVFYTKKGAFLHFHEDNDSIYGDIKIENEWKRYPANTSKEQMMLLRVVQKALQP